MAPVMINKFQEKYWASIKIGMGTKTIFI